MCRLDVRCSEQSLVGQNPQFLHLTFLSLSFLFCKIRIVIKMPCSIYGFDQDSHGSGLEQHLLWLLPG